MTHKNKSKDKDKVVWDKLTLIAVESLRTMVKRRLLVDEEPFQVLGQMAALLTLYLEDQVKEGKDTEPVCEYTADEVLEYIEDSYTEFLKTYRGTGTITFKNNLSS